MLFIKFILTFPFLFSIPVNFFSLFTFKIPLKVILNILLFFTNFILLDKQKRMIFIKMNLNKSDLQLHISKHRKKDNTYDIKENNIYRDMR